MVYALPLRRPAAHATWMQYPTIWPSMTRSTSVDVVGEGYRQPILEHLAGGKTHDGVSRRHCSAQLVLEPQNEHDPNAVAVLIGGHHVGYIAREETLYVRETVRFLDGEGVNAVCRARFTGGWQRGAHDSGSIGVKLDIDLTMGACRPEQLMTVWPVVPGYQGDRTVKDTKAAQAHLVELRIRQRRDMVMGSLVLGDDASIEVFHEDVRIGCIDPAVGLQIIDPLLVLTGAGYPATVWLTLRELKSSIGVRALVATGL